MERPALKPGWRRNAFVSSACDRVQRKVRRAIGHQGHEIWTFWPLLNKNYLVQELHRRKIAKLLTEANVIFTSTASQAEHLRTLVRRTVEVFPWVRTSACPQLRRVLASRDARFVWRTRSSCLNILSSIGGVAEAEPLCWLTPPAELLHGVSTDELKTRGEKLREWQKRTDSWPVIAEKFAQALQM